MDNKFQEELHIAYKTRVKLNLVEPPPKVKSHVDRIRAELMNTKVPNISGAHLVVKTKQETYGYPLTQSIKIGVDKNNDLRFKSEYLSGQHCSLKKDDDLWLIQDLDSTNGVYLNGNKIDMKYLKEGDLVQICDVTLIFFCC